MSVALLGKAGMGRTRCLELRQGFRLLSLKQPSKMVAFHRDWGVPKRRQESAADGRAVIKDSSIVGRIKAATRSARPMVAEWLQAGPCRRPDRLDPPEPSALPSDALPLVSRRRLHPFPLIARRGERRKTAIGAPQ